MSSAGWVCTTLVFVWPLLAALAALLPLGKSLRGNRPRAWQCAAALPLTLYAANMELLAGLLTLLLLPVACKRQVVETRPTIPLVREIIADRSDPRAQMLRERVSVPLSDITIIGSEFACDRLAEGFSFRDKQDNVDARVSVEGTSYEVEPDMAGEYVLLLWGLILATVVAFWRVRPLAGALLLPYLAWVSFACALTWATWRLNPGLLG